MYIRIYVHIYVYIHIYMHMYMYINTHTQWVYSEYIHKHTCLPSSGHNQQISLKVCPIPKLQTLNHRLLILHPKS